MMTNRNALLVGSLPFLHEKDAMTKAIQILGDSLFALPDGEIGEKSEVYPNGNRSAWIMSIIDGCKEDKENWDTIDIGERSESGFPSDYKHLTKLRAKHTANDIDPYLNFGYLDAFKQSYPIFQRLREEHNIGDVKFQVGIPTGLAIGFIMLRTLDAFRYQEAFNRRLAYEVNEIVKIAGDDVVIQIEAPAEVALAEQLPKVLVRVAVNSLMGLVEKLDQTVNIGLHLCWGDLNNKALTHAKSLDKMVYLTNKLLQKWPTHYKLAYVHFPLAEADVPPSLDELYYKPLKYVHLPEDVRFIAGFIHEGRSIEELNKILKILDTTRGRKVDIACSCGLGRRSPEVAMHLLEMTKQLLEIKEGYSL
jgi:hypothetical protein